MDEKEAISQIREYCIKVHNQVTSKPKWISSTVIPQELEEAVNVVGKQKYFIICLETLCKGDKSGK